MNLKKGLSTLKVIDNVRSFFPRSCPLDVIDKMQLHAKSKDSLKSAFDSLDGKQKFRIKKTVILSNSPGIDFAKKYLCANCSHPNCKHQPPVP